MLVSTWSHFVPTWSPLVAASSNFGSYWVPIWSALGPTLVPFSPHLVSVSSHLIPIRSHLGFVLGSRKASKTSEESTLNTFRFWYPLGFVAVLGRVLQVSWAIFEASLDVLGASWRVLERLAWCLRVVLDWIWGVLRAFLGILRRLGTSSRRPGAVLGHVGGVLGRLGGASLGVLEVSWGVLSLEPFSACPGTVSEASWH